MCMLLSFQRPPRLAGGDSPGFQRSQEPSAPEGATESSARGALGNPHAPGNSWTINMCVSLHSLVGRRLCRGNYARVDKPTE